MISIEMTQECLAISRCQTSNPSNSTEVEAFYQQVQEACENLNPKDSEQTTESNFSEMNKEEKNEEEPVDFDLHPAITSLLLSENSPAIQDRIEGDFGLSQEEQEVEQQGLLANEAPHLSKTHGMTQEVVETPGWVEIQGTIEAQRLSEASKIAHTSWLVEAELQETAFLTDQWRTVLTPLENKTTSNDPFVALEGLLSDLEQDQTLDLKWEVSSTDSSQLSPKLSTSAWVEGDPVQASQRISGGWSAQYLSEKAEELGVEAPEAGFNQRLETLLSQVSSFQDTAQVFTMPSVEAEPLTEVHWNQREVLFQQVMDHVTHLQEGDSSKLSLTLFPKHLGTMQLEFEMIQGELRGRIVTQSKEVSQWMEKAIQSLSSETLSLKTVQVETQSATDSFLFHQQQSQREQQESDYQATLWKQGAFLAEEEEGKKDTYSDQEVRFIF